MKSRIQYLFAFLIGILLFLHIAGCKKSGSIVGTWTLYSESYLYSVTNQYVFDTIFSTSSPMTVTFRADGSMSSSTRIYPLPTRGTYTLNGGKLNYYDSVYQTRGTVSYDIQRSKTLYVTYNDTVSNVPNEYYEKTYNFGR